MSDETVQLAFHRTHSSAIAGREIGDCFYCGRERAKCKAKIWYANLQAGVMASKNNGQAYECPWCDGFHVTTKVRAETR